MRLRVSANRQTTKSLTDRRVRHSTSPSTGAGSPRASRVDSSSCLHAARPNDAAMNVLLRLGHYCFVVRCLAGLSTILVRAAPTFMSHRMSVHALSHEE